MDKKTHSQEWYKIRKKLIKTIIILVLSVLVVLAITLGWFVTLWNNTVDFMDFMISNPQIGLYQSVDLDGDYVPDRTEDTDEIVFVPEPQGRIVIRPVFPGCVYHFKAQVTTMFWGGDVSGRIESILVPELQELDPETLPPEDGIYPDVADALYIKYIDPHDGVTEIDKPLSELFLPETRNIDLFNYYTIPGDTVFEFYYTIYMPNEMGNEYQNKQLIMELVHFRVD